MPNNDDQLQQQYQEILNKYASSISPPPPIDIPPEVPESPKLDLEPKVDQMPIDIDTSPVDAPTKEPETLPLAPIIETPKLNLEAKVDQIPVDIDEKLISPPIYFPPETENNKPSNFSKYLFYFSLIIFITVASAIGYNFINSQQVPVPTNDTVPATSSATETKFCELNDTKIAVGQTFPATDSCNVCSCNPDSTILCTENACDTDESVLGTSATPTKKVETKVYKDIKYGYQFECPITFKYQLVGTSVDGNKFPYKVETCTDGEAITTISVYDNTVIHSFGNVETQISPDKKYVIEMISDYPNIISSFKFL